MNNKQKCIVTVTDGISPTSMPFNEFILYRLGHYPEEKQVLIQVFEHGVDGDVVIPNEVEYYSLGIKLSSIRKKIHELEKKYDVKAYHIHEGKSVILFSVATFLRFRKKTIYTLHSTYKNYPFHNKLFSFCASLLARDVVCVSKTSLKYYPKILKVLRGSHAMYIQNGVDTERIESVVYVRNNKDEPFTMIYVARLVALKRHYMLFEALKYLSNVKLQLIGTGPLENDLKQRISDLGIEGQVEFLGLKTREDVYKLMKDADLYVSSSSYEGLPIGVLEAMGCGTPCLVSNIEQHAEIAEKCPTLQLCPDDINQWIHRIQCQMKLSKSDIEIVKMRNKQSVLKNFSLESMHKHYNELYFQYES